MIRISLSIVNPRDGTGTRIDRFEKDDGLYDETSEEFIRRHKAKKNKGDLGNDIPKNQESSRVFVRPKIWAGRRERETARKKARRTLPNVM